MVVLRLLLTRPAAPQIKEMVLCSICGSKLIVGEPHDSHLAGKQHLGYAAMRDKISEYKVCPDPRRAPGCQSIARACTATR
jgi:hypothetical protein